MEAIGNGFFMRDIRVENTAGAENHQAVALRVQSDQAVFYQCTFDGYQDTLYTHAQRQFFRDCRVTGTIDFIFGNSQVVLQNCLIQPRKPMANQANIITAPAGRSPPTWPAPGRSTPGRSTSRTTSAGSSTPRDGSSGTATSGSRRSSTRRWTTAAPAPT
jgi:hypothetical protein